MTPENFCYWLKGVTEITNGAMISARQWEVISKHLDLVFTQVIDSPSILGVDIVESAPFEQELFEQLAIDRKFHSIFLPDGVDIGNKLIC